jgi:hypothetical protein
VTTQSPRPSGLQVFAAVIAIVMLTAVVPPISAWALNRHRVTQTATRAESMARRLEGQRAQLTEAVVADGIAVACGPGRMPDREPAGLWVNRAVHTPTLLPDTLPVDGWGRCFLVNIEALRPGAEGTPVWVISAGPDGVIDTHPAAAVLQGDDVGSRVQ